jgi:hypothetical protein
MVSAILAGAGGGAVISIIIRAIDNYSRQFKKLDKDIKTQQSGFKKLTGILKSTGIGYGMLAGAAVGFGISAVKTYMEAERAARAFNAVLDEQAETMLKDLREASQGLASDIALMDSANKAMALGIDKNKLPQLLKVASARGKVTGRTVTQAFEDISLGIGRQSRLILDNLGIIINLDEAYKDYADTLGKTSKELTEVEKKTALTNKVLAESEYIMRLMEFQTETTGEKLQRLNVIWTDFKTNVGASLVGLVDTAGELKKVATGYDIFSDEVKSFDYESSMKAQLKEWENITEQVNSARQAVEDYLTEMTNLATGPFLDIVEQEKRIADIELNLAEQRKLLGVAERENQKGRAEQIRINIRNLEEERNSEKDLLNEAKARQDVIQATINLELLKREEDAKTTRQILFNLNNTIKGYDEVIDNYSKLSNASKEWEKSHKNSVENIIDQTTRLKSFLVRAYEAIGNIGWSFGAERKISGAIRQTTVGDAIIRPSGEIIRTHPNDTLIATQNPGGINIHIEAIYGMDPEEVSRALLDELSAKVSI